MNTFLEEQALKNISIEDIRTYLQQNEWQQVPYADTRLQVFVLRNSASKPALLMLPVDHELTDFYPRLADALAILARSEQLPTSILLQILQTTGNDVIRLRLQLPEDQRPSIPLVAQFLEGLYNLVVYAACMELSGRRRYFNRPFDEGLQETQQFQFGHTFQGSFGFTMAAPTIQPTLIEEKPFVGRRIVERITRGLLTVQKAEMEQDSSVISQQYEEGMNGNMCYAAATMLESLHNIKVEYSVNWSPRVQVPSDIAHLQAISLASTDAPYLQQAGKRLRETAKTGAQDLGEKDIHGTVTELKQASNRRFVIIESPHYQQKIQADLADDDYRKAANAHLDRRPISVRGTLIRQKSALLLLNASGVIVR